MKEIKDVKVDINEINRKLEYLYRELIYNATTFGFGDGDLYEIQEDIRRLERIKYNV